ncbi:MAG: hypothetical protein AMXMBFR84_02670 [Candidatus Hydrogenedentota bacterium]
MNYLRYFPLMAVLFAVYNIAMLAGVNFEENPALFGIPHLTREAPIPFGASDLLIGIAAILLYLEIMKASRVSRSTVVDHMLSMFVFIAFLVEMITVAGAGTATFILLTLISLIDVIAGFTISIATARRDFTVGNDGMG